MGAAKDYLEEGGKNRVFEEIGPYITGKKKMDKRHGNESGA